MSALMLCFSWYAEAELGTCVLMQCCQVSCIQTSDFTCLILCCLQALAECGLVQDKSCQTLGSSSAQNDNGNMLVCNKLLSARCVRQQIESIQQRQLQDRQIAIGVSVQQCSKQSTVSELQEHRHTDRQAGFDVTKARRNTQEIILGGGADVTEPNVDSQTCTETTGAAAATSSCIR